MSSREIKDTGAKSKDLVSFIRRNRKTGIPTFVFGAPGVGKSEMVHQAADGEAVIDVRLSMLDPVDLRGLPTTIPDGKGGTRVAWALPDFIPADGKGIIFFDELNTAPVAVQNAALQIILDRKCGPHKLGDGWYIVACGNKSSHRAHVNPLSAPLRNRFSIVDYVPSVEAWTGWAVNNRIHDHIIAFLNFAPDHLSSSPSDEYSNFASPRSWARVSRLMEHGVNNDIEATTSLIGRGSAVAFSSFCEEIEDMPDIDALIEGKEKFSHTGKRISISYAVATTIAGRLLRSDSKNLTKGYVDRCSEIAAELPAEIACLFFVMCLGNNNDSSRALRVKILTSSAGQSWAKKHRNLLEKYNVSSLAD
jgi:hypothetical protein